MGITFTKSEVSFPNGEELFLKNMRKFVDDYSHSTFSLFKTALDNDGNVFGLFYSDKSKLIHAISVNLEELGYINCKSLRKEQEDSHVWTLHSFFENQGIARELMLFYEDIIISNENASQEITLTCLGPEDNKLYSIYNKKLGYEKIPGSYSNSIVLELKKNLDFNKYLLSKWQLKHFGILQKADVETLNFIKYADNQINSYLSFKKNK